MSLQKDTTESQAPARAVEPRPAGAGGEIVQMIGRLQDLRGFRDQHWEGTFEEYLEIVRQNPRVTRTAFQRVYDMILAHGTREYHEYKKKIVHYNFFDDKDHGGSDGVFGLDVPLMKLVNVFKSAAQRYGTEKRVLLLHGPVGSAKSTIVRRLKRGLEDYSKTPDGPVYSFYWVMDGGAGPSRRRKSCPAPCTRSRSISSRRICDPRSRAT
jgi:serine protein kinase